MVQIVLVSLLLVLVGTAGVAASAEPGTAGAAASAEPGGIKACIDSSIVAGKLRLTHVTEGAGDVISRDEWVIRCEGVGAIAAWDRFYVLRRDEPVERDLDLIGTRGLVMKTGTSSRCFKVTHNPDGSPPGKIVCDVSLDLAPGFYQGELGR